MPPNIPAEGPEEGRAGPSDAAKPGTTTISTIAVRAEPHTTIVIAMVKSQGDIELRIDQMTPGLLEIGEKLEEAEVLFDRHTDLMARLATKQSQVEELLTRADQLVHEQKEDDVAVYESMAESLSVAWQELNRQLELRGFILEDILGFHEKAKHHEKLVAKICHYLKKLASDEDDDNVVQTIRDGVDELIQTTVEAVDLGSDLITQIRVLGALADNLERPQEVVDACLLVEKIMLKISSDWEYVETCWSEEKERIKADEDFDNGTLKKVPEQAKEPKKVDHVKLGAQLNAIEAWLHGAKRKFKKDPKVASSLADEAESQLESLSRLADTVHRNIPSSPLATKLDLVEQSVLTFVDELKSGHLGEDRVQAFLRNADLVRNQLDQMERDLQTASAALAGELAPLAKQKAGAVLEEGGRLLQQQGRSAAVADALDGLRRRLAEVEALARRRVDLSRHLSGRHLQLAEWLRASAEPFLADNGQLGAGAGGAARFREVHQQFATALLNKDAEVRGVVQQAHQLNEEGRRQIEDFKKRYDNVRTSLENREQLVNVYQQTFKFGNDLDKTATELTNLLNDKTNLSDELAQARVQNLLQALKEALSQEQHQVAKLGQVCEGARRTDLHLRTQAAEEAARRQLQLHAQLQAEVAARAAQRQRLRAAAAAADEVQRWQTETARRVERLERGAAPPAEAGRELRQLAASADLDRHQEHIRRLQQDLQPSQDAHLQERLDVLHRDHQLLKRRIADLAAAEAAAEAEAAPRFLDPLLDLDVAEGTPAEFAVRVRGASRADWLKDGRLLRPTADLRPHFDGHTARLFIERACPEDAAVFTLLAQGPAASANQSARLQVMPRPKSGHTPNNEGRPQFVRQLQSQHVQVGQTAVLECVCVARPEPRVTWLKDEQALQESDRIRLQFIGDRCSLTVNDAQVADSGLYTVQAKNPHGETTNFCRLQVTAAQPKTRTPSPAKPQTPLFDPALVNQVVKEGESVVLEVKTLGSPLPLVQWDLDEKPIEESDNVALNFDEHGWSRLVIKSASPESAGLYTVRATNEAGEARTTATLTIIPAHVLQTGQNTQQHHRQHHQVTRTTQSPQLRQEHYQHEKQVLIQQLQKVHQDYHHDLSAATSSPPRLLHKTQSAYESSRLPAPDDCSDFGFSSLANAPQFIRAFQPEYTVHEGEKAQLDCLMVGNPRPKVHWFFNDRPIHSNWQFAEFPNIGDTYFISFAPAKLANSGFYRIVAENVRGRTECTTLIHVRPKSLIPPPGTRKTPTRVSREFAATDYSPTPILYANPGPPRVQHQSMSQSDHFYREQPSPHAYAVHARTASPVQTHPRDYPTAPQPVYQSAGGAVCHPQQGQYNEYVQYEEQYLQQGSPQRQYQGSPQRQYQGSPQRQYQGSPQGQYQGSPQRQYQHQSSPQKQPSPQRHQQSPQQFGQRFPQGPVYRLDSQDEKFETVQNVQQSQQMQQRQTHPLQHQITDGEPPHFLQTLTSFVASVGEGGSFEAVVSGRPAPDLAWSKDGQPIDAATHPHIRFVDAAGRAALLFRNAQVEDCGKYMCSARNELGVATSSAQFVVRPNTIAPDFDQRLISEEVAEGDQLCWTVKVTGDPQPTVTWLRNSEPIPNCEEVRLISDGNGTHCLLIGRVELADGGQFTCVAENVAGEARSTADLVVRERDAEPGTYYHITKVTQEKRVNGEDVAQNEQVAIESPKMFAH